MPDARYQKSGMSFVTYGTDLFSPHGTTTIPTPSRPLFECSNEFATFTSPCMKASVPRGRQSPNLATMILRSIRLPHIPCAILTTIFQLLTRLSQALPSPEMTAKTTEDTTHTPAISPVLLQASESTLLASTPATVSHSPGNSCLFE
jgi:hypothetical protein